MVTSIAGASVRRLVQGGPQTVSNGTFLEAKTQPACSKPKANPYHLSYGGC
jgi:hypothetical protein